MDDTEEIKTDGESHALNFVGKTLRGAHLDTTGDLQCVTASPSPGLSATLSPSDREWDGVRGFAVSTKLVESLGHIEMCECSIPVAPVGSSL